MSLPKWAKYALDDINKNFKNNSLRGDILKFADELSIAHKKIEELEIKIQLQNIVIETLSKENER